MKRMIFAALIIALVAVASLTGSAMQRDLAVKYVSNGAGQTLILRLYLQGDSKRRTEQEGASSEPVPAGLVDPNYLVNIVRRDLGLVWTLNTQKRTCFEAPLPSSKIPVPEPSYRKFPKVGQETVLGYVCEVHRSTPEYEYGPQAFWYAPDLGITLKSETGEGEMKATMEAVEVRIERLPDALFEVPPGYRRFTLDELLQRDVTLSFMESALFDHAQSVTADAPLLNKRFFSLSKDLISDLQACLKTCTGLMEAPGSIDYRTADLLIYVDRKCLSYSALTGTVSIRKMDINEDRLEDYLLHKQLKDKYLMGVYRFNASPEFKAFAQRLIQIM